MVSNQIFISYSQNDINEVYQITSFLENKNIKFWYDYRLNDDPGVQWKEEINNMILQSSAFIVILSEKSVNSESVKAEYKRARDKNLKIIPIITDQKFLEPESTVLNDFPGIKDYHMIRKYSTDYNLSEFQIGLMAIVNNLIGISIQTRMDLYPIMDKHQTVVGFTLGDLIHRLPMAYHRTIIAIFFNPAEQQPNNKNPQIILQVKPRQARSAGSLAFFGGHCEINESYHDTAIREIGEESNCPIARVKKQPLIRIGDDGEFTWEFSDYVKERHNYEFSSLYVFHLDDKPHFFQETYNSQIIPLLTLKITLEDLYQQYVKQPTVGAFCRVYEKSYIQGNPEELKEFAKIKLLLGAENEKIRFSDDIQRLFKDEPVFRNQWQGAIEDAINHPYNLTHPKCTRIK